MTLSMSDILAARKTISGKVIRAPLLPSRYFSERAGAPFFMKMETMQPTGAFKLRGATNAALNAPEGTTKLTCCSTGNHGRAVAHAAHTLGLQATICMSSLVPKAKVDGIIALGAQAHIKGRSQDEALAECRRLSQSEGVYEIPPFDHPLVIAGQGTIGLEMLEDQPDMAAILVPLSGGGLAAGVALAAKSINPKIKVIGITMERGAAMFASVQAGRPVEVEEVASLADSLGGGIGLDNQLTFTMCRDLLDDIILVSEDEIYHAQQALYYEEAQVAEGASVVGIAALLAGKLPIINGPIGTIITGRNLDMGDFTRIIAGEDITLGNDHLKGRPYAP
ncbi:hydroxyectoine utilization dehydratase EutB [Rhizobium sp. L1K21]|uniref:hydroxyectoine utilization dehydratase EutB n=1 Tax=Rhizobium sp. L1K21 TaxID=2954933 RepID=UPI002092DEA8|nr:hydroxyectoine utilization dehydratase EutB [Rhizobium sp. L1K21]MCO6185283.1 hydroxyectoine utilization dehydratase EutB [Rhizobium sp. L1K21]